LLGITSGDQPRSGDQHGHQEIVPYDLPPSRRFWDRQDQCTEGRRIAPALRHKALGDKALRHKALDCKGRLPPNRRQRDEAWTQDVGDRVIPPEQRGEQHHWEYDEARYQARKYQTRGHPQESRHS